MKRGLWLSGILLGLLLVLILIRSGYTYPWTGLGRSKVNGEVQPAKTLWDWLDLLIIPVVLALGGYLFTRSENLRTREAADRQRTLDRQIADDQSTLDRQIADERRQDDTLQAYLDGMSQLLTDKERPLHRAQPGDSLSTVARARTLTVLGRLDSGRKRSVLQFLLESGLIYHARPVLELGGADLTEADLSDAILSDAYLSGAYLDGANLSGAYLDGANLYKANLSNGELSNAYLGGADLGNANLRDAELSNAYLRDANLTSTNLSGANLHNANLGNAELSNAYLSGANLAWANLGEARRWTERQLLIAKSLDGAQMPDGQVLKSNHNPDGPTLEDWLKNKSREEDGKNGGSP